MKKFQPISNTSFRKYGWLVQLKHTFNKQKPNPFQTEPKPQHPYCSYRIKNLMVLVRLKKSMVYIWPPVCISNGGNGILNSAIPKNNAKEFTAPRVPSFRQIDGLFAMANFKIFAGSNHGMWSVFDHLFVLHFEKRQLHPKRCHTKNLHIRV